MYKGSIYFVALLINQNYSIIYLLIIIYFVISNYIYIYILIKEDLNIYIQNLYEIFLCRFFQIRLKAILAALKAGALNSLHSHCTYLLLRYLHLHFLSRHRTAELLGGCCSSALRCCL